MSRNGLQESDSPESVPNRRLEHVASHPLEFDSDEESYFTDRQSVDRSVSPFDSVLKPGGVAKPDADTTFVTNKIAQAGTEQTANTISSYSPTSLSNARGMAHSMQSLAQQVAHAAAQRANLAHASQGKPGDTVSLSDITNAQKPTIIAQQAHKDHTEQVAAPTQQTTSGKVYQSVTHSDPKLKNVLLEEADNVPYLLDLTASYLYHTAGLFVGLTEGLWLLFPRLFSR